MKKIISLSLILIISSVNILAQMNSPSNVVLSALQDELKRSTAELQLKNFEKPYFIEYKLQDIQTYRIDARFGALTVSGGGRARRGSAQVRVGDYEFDNSNSFGGGMDFSSIESIMDAVEAGGGGQTLPYEDDYEAIRQRFWLMTDSAYKSAIEQIAAKRASIKNNPPDEVYPDLSKENPVTDLTEAQKIELDVPKFEKMIKNLSAIFKNYPDIINSNVSMFVFSSDNLMINNEGFLIRKPSNYLGLNIQADTQTEDGYNLGASRTIYGKTLASISDEAELTKIANDLANDLLKTRSAPKFDETYIGPVLLTENAAVNIFAQSFASNLINRRGSGSRDLSDRINRRVLPSFLSMTDNPSLDKIGKTELPGAYKFDSQGIEAKPLTLVENGILKNVLTSRTPTKFSKQSNGRSGGISNLIVEANVRKTFAELKAELINQCKILKIPFGIMIKGVNSGGSSIYKVYVEDGREELVRGANVEGVSLQDFRQILAAGDDAWTVNFPSRGGDANVSSVTAPSILMEEMVLRKDGFSKSRPYILTNPYFDKKQ
jgi:predicted Zn-dependent protease